MDALSELKDNLSATIDRLPSMSNGKWIQRALEAILRLSESEIDRLDWKILSAAIGDMERAFEVFYPYRHVRKVAVFGSARTSETVPEYQLAYDFAQLITQQGFMTITGAGGGIMAAANAGAGSENSFGLNIQLPYEQSANKYILGDPKTIAFKYFFTRKLFFLRESDAVVLFPGGFGTLDEALETLTLCQTGRYGPVPIVLLDRPGGTYWRDWDAYLRQHLAATGLISPGDLNLYTIADDIHVAAEAIRNFYQVYHSSRYVGDMFVMRLKVAICDGDLELLNQEFGDLAANGKIVQTTALPQESDDPTVDLPRLVFKFDRRDFGRLYQMIGRIGRMDGESCLDTHPEAK
ncbi:LOG family protein [Chamaesiphon polymorphus]|uniref:Cytochrome D ubiquinol oxidase subunit II n=1 Tax=Chamaesiphon polymorphus CCALA 037 TaxID=2107692 RepID=A0A2T1GHJ3_9CYAN|nr:LOG family protein [Chamaesiphon polymorphus]PSB57171.1 cytochrome D ubiquinol oxidase subunit II [Chamaesiphon polymorphus CCALA 037]